MGSIADLTESMKTIGLLNPIIITNNKELLAGFRRLEAAKSLGWDTIECKIVNAYSNVIRHKIESDENIQRKNFTQNEISDMEEVNRYLSSKGFKKFMLLIKRFIKWIKSFIFS